MAGVALQFLKVPSQTQTIPWIAVGWEGSSGLLCPCRTCPLLQGRLLTAPAVSHSSVRVPQLPCHTDGVPCSTGILHGDNSIPWALRMSLLVSLAAPIVPAVFPEEQPAGRALLRLLCPREMSQLLLHSAACACRRGGGFLPECAERRHRSRFARVGGKVSGKRK